jgi:DNA-binding NarL/FixJ family response regulator
VLELIAKGHNNQEIANTLVITHKTVRNHVSNIYSKLRVVDRAQALIRTRDAGMGSSKPWSSACIWKNDLYLLHA